MHRLVATPTGSEPTGDITFESKLLGALAVPEHQVLEFANGLFGFPEARGFALLPAEREGFFWLQSQEFEALTFLLIDPFAFVEGYSVDLGPKEIGELMPADASEIAVLAILTLPKELGETATANLQGPLALNAEKRIGKQLALDSPYGIRFPVDLSSTRRSEAP